MKRIQYSPRTLLANLDSRIQLAIIGVIVGILGGFAALGLNFSLDKLQILLAPYKKDFLIVLLPVAGILLTALFLRYVIKDAEGHGVPEVIYSVSMRGGFIKLRSSISRLIGSLLTLSAGGSAGPEAPVAISGAAIGSNIATWFQTNDRIRIAATGSGAAAAIASIFNAPITGFIFSMEVILGEWSAVNMLPVALASVTGTVISRLFNGNQIPFVHQKIEVGLNDIAASLFFALVAACIAILFIKTMRLSQKRLQKILRPVYLRALCGGLAVGVIINFFPQVKGQGYGVIRSLLGGSVSIGLAMLFVLIIFKVLATSLTLNSGGAGGVFAPSLVIGCFTGYFFYQLLIFIFPKASFSGLEMFALCGMAAMLSGTLHSPLTGVFLIVEITGGYDVILPLLIASFLTLTIVKLVEKNSVYFHELVEEGLLRRPRTDARILTDIGTKELLEKELIPVKPESVLKELIPIIIRSRRNIFPVIETRTGTYLGILDWNDIKSYIFDKDLSQSIIVEEVMHHDLPTVSISDTMIEILNKMEASQAWSLPVVENNKFVGLVSKSTILDHYRKELKAQTEE
ncbi:MAG: chloride channel protein [Candidatus Aminicenantes bacterium]|nr:chloride channel protein [Candidatus Aminicenantes bacterium]